MTESDAIKNVTALIEEMEHTFREVPEFLGLTPKDLLGCTFAFGTLTKEFIWPEIVTSSILGVTQHIDRHISLSIPKVRLGGSFCERLVYRNGVWAAIDITGLQYVGSLLIQMP